MREPAHRPSNSPKLLVAALFLLAACVLGTIALVPSTGSALPIRGLTGPRAPLLNAGGGIVAGVHDADNDGEAEAEDNGAAEGAVAGDDEEQEPIDAAALAAAIAKLPVEDDNCYRCHANADIIGEFAPPDSREGQRLLIDPEAVLTDIHIQRGLSCADCHGGDPTVSEEAAAEVWSADSDVPYEYYGSSMGRDAVFRGLANPFIGSPNRLKIPEYCSLRCHSNVTYMRRFNPALPTDQFQKYEDSVHGKLNRLGDIRTATCIDCHGVHGIRPSLYPESMVYPSNVPRTCGVCHSGDGPEDFLVADTHGDDALVPTGQYMTVSQHFVPTETYAASLGDPDSPTVAPQFVGITGEPVVDTTPSNPRTFTWRVLDGRGQPTDARGLPIMNTWKRAPNEATHDVDGTSVLVFIDDEGREIFPTLSVRGLRWKFVDPETSGTPAGPAMVDSVPIYRDPHGDPIATDQVERFARSVHGEALLRKESPDLAAPACNDCHGNHAAAPPETRSVSQVCRNCHVSNGELFDSSPHKTAWPILMELDESLSLPECETCHGNHAIERADYSMLDVASAVWTASESPCIESACHLEPDEAEVARLDEAIRPYDERLDELHLELDPIARAIAELRRRQGEIGVMLAQEGLPDDEVAVLVEELDENRREIRNRRPELESLRARIVSEQSARYEFQIDRGRYTGYKAAMEMHDSLVSLQERRDKVSRQLHKAAILGMSVEREYYDLAKVDEAVTEARALVHAFDIELFSTSIERGEEQVEVSETAAQAKLDEFQFRRVGFGVATGIITLFILMLFLVIRDVDERTGFLSARKRLRGAEPKRDTKSTEGEPSAFPDAG